MGIVKKIARGVLICALCALCALSAYAEIEYVDTYTIFGSYSKNRSTDVFTSINRSPHSSNSDLSTNNFSFSLSDLDSKNFYTGLSPSLSETGTTAMTFQNDYTYFFVLTYNFVNSSAVNGVDPDWVFDFTENDILLYDKVNLAQSNASRYYLDDFLDTDHTSGGYWTGSVSSYYGELDHQTRTRPVSVVVYYHPWDDNPYTSFCGIALEFSRDNLMTTAFQPPVGSSVAIRLSSLHSYYDPEGNIPETGDDPPEEVEDIIQSQIDAQRDATLDDYNSAFGDNAEDAAALFNGESFISAFDGIISAMSYAGTDFNFQFPALSFPYLENVSTDAVDIPLKYWIDQIPSGFLYALRMMGWLGLVFSIIHWVKKFITLFDGISDKAD